jgi:hypothetical protein
MSGAIPLLPRYAFMAWCSVKEHLYQLFLPTDAYRFNAHNHPMINNSWNWYNVIKDSINQSQYIYTIRLWDFLLFTTRPDRPWGSSSLLSNGYRRLFPGGITAEVWSWPLTSTGVKVKNAPRYTSNPPYVFKAWCSIKQRIRLHSAVLC